MRLRGIITFSLVAVALAGCLEAEELHPGELVCRQGHCNFQATPEPTRQANELSIAVNPRDPLNIIASGKDYFPAEAGDCVRDGLYVTFDGGVTWETMNVPGSPWKTQSDPTQFSPDADLSKYWCVTDPVVEFDDDGTAYWSIMPYQCDPVTGSKTGDGLHPDGGFNDWFWSCSSMYVLVSEDGGRTWPIIRELAFGPRLEHDKQWMAISDTGTILVCWDRDPSYQVGSLLGPGSNAADQLTAAGYMVCSTSDDQGRTWSEVTDVNPPGTWSGFLPWIDWGPDGAWLAAINPEGEVIVSRSDDGLAWEAPMVVGTYENPPANGAFGWPALNGSAFRTFALPSLAVDRSDGPTRGTIHVAWMDHSVGYGQILYTRSTDGETWAEPVRLRDDGANPTHDQFMPAINVGSDGILDAIWFDRRDDPDNYLYALYHSYSPDGGETWSPDLKVSEHLSDEQFSHHQNGMVFLGDYIDLDATPGQAHVVWVDTRNEKADAFVATIQRG